MKKINKFLALFLLLSLGLTSCEKEQQQDDDDDDDTQSEVTEKEVTLSRETDYGDSDWIYFNFKSGEEVAEITPSNYQNSLDWDIAFNRQNIRTNGGISGTGLAEVKDLGEIDFTSVKEAPESGYSVDDSISIVENVGTMPPPMVTVTGSSVFVGAITFTGPPPAFTPNNHIYAMKTAEGKYVKIWIKNFYNDQSESGYITLKYAHQNDGTRNFE